VRLGGSSRKAVVSAWIRAVAAFVVFVVAGDHSLASLHQALTVHEVCAEHGELVHDGGAHGATTAPNSAPTAEPGAFAEDEHHHCGVVPAAPTRSAAVGAADECPLANLAVVETFDSFEADLPTADVLAFAPKLSPPV
jgi:hypothetical protein